MDTTTTRKRTRMSKAARREAILQAALRSFVERGYHGTHVAQIVEAAGVARGTFYLYFDSKRDVFAALVDRMLAVFLAARPTEPEPIITDRESAAEVLRISFTTVLQTFRQHRLLCRLLLEEAVGAEQGFTDQLEAHYDVWRARVAETLRLFLKMGVARPDLDVPVTTEMVIGMVERVTRRHVLREEAPDIPRLVKALVDFEMTGIGAVRA